MILKTFSLKWILNILIVAAVCMFLATMLVTQSGCGVYRFKDVSIPDSVKVVRVKLMENKAPYVNPQLAPKLTEALVRKIVTQTKLSQTNGDNADWDIACKITGYSFTTAGISNQRVNTNNLNVNISIEVLDKKSQKTSKYDVTRSFPYDGTLALQQAEQKLEPDMLRDLSDDIFNRIFSNW